VVRRRELTGGSPDFRVLKHADGPLPGHHRHKRPAVANGSWTCQATAQRCAWEARRPVPATLAAELAMLAWTITVRSCSVVQPA
jgi:hypothetical protein